MAGIRPLKITFEIDPDGIIFDPYVPIHLDALVDWALSPMVRKNRHAPTRSEQPEEIRLPLGKWRIGNYWGWSASALIPVANNEDDEILESIQYFRKRFRQDAIHQTVGMPNTQSGPLRGYNLPYIKQHPRYMIGYCVGNAKRLRGLLKRNLRYLGQKRNRGKGRIVSMTVEGVSEDRSAVYNNKAMRWLPDEAGLRMVRLRPPYWNNVDRVYCCEVGDEYHQIIVARNANKAMQANY